MQPEITKIDTDEKKGFAIVVSCCAACPYVAKACNFHEYICNHPKRVAFKPYCNDRLVNPHIIDDNCVLLQEIEPQLHDIAIGANYEER